MSRRDSARFKRGFDDARLIHLTYSSVGYLTPIELQHMFSTLIIVQQY
jgi:hypothetical protein